MKIMKKVAALAMVMLLTFALTGCMKFDVNVNVNKDGTADVSILYAMMSSLGDMSSAFSDQQIASMESAGWTLTQYDQDGYVGYLMEQKNASLLEKSYDDTFGQVVDLGAEDYLTIDGRTITLDLDILEGADISEINSYGSAVKEYGGSATITISLPIKPDEHNATTVSDDGKTLTWDMLEMEEGQHIYMKVTKPNTTLHMILAAVAAIAVIAALAFFFLRKKKKADEILEMYAADVNAEADAVEEQDAIDVIAEAEVANEQDAIDVIAEAEVLEEEVAEEVADVVTEVIDADKE